MGWPELQRATKGRWPTLLPANGVSEEFLSPKQGPCPKCGGKTRFRFEDKDGSGKWFCNTCCPKGSDGFGLVALVKNIDRNDAIKEIAEQVGQGLSAEKKADKREESRTPMETLSKRWNESIAINSKSAAGKYLAKRGLKTPQSDDLGSHPALDYWESDGPGRPKKVGTYHALIALVTNVNGDPVGLQYIYLTADGDKAPVPSPKKRQVAAEGGSSGACVKLDAAGETIAIAEGIETGIYVRGVSGLPTWCGMTANIMAAIEVPPEVKAVYIFADNDKSGTGLKAAYDLADRLVAQGVTVYILLPAKVDQDWLDAKNLTKDMIAAAKPYSYLDRWPDVKPLHKLLDVMPFDECMIPECWRPYARDLAATLQVPMDFIALSLMAVFATIIGASCAVRPKAKASWQEVCNMWGLLIGYPSQLKTPTTMSVMSLINRLEERSEREYKEALKKYEREKDSYQLQRTTLKGLIRQEMKKSSGGDALARYKKSYDELEPPTEPVEKCFYTNDATIEALYKTLAENPRGVLLYRDELSAQLIAWDSPRRAGEKQFFMEGHKGLGKFKRKTKSTGTEKPKNIISLFGTMTPDTVKHYVNYAQKFGSDGFLQRLQLMAYPNLNEQDWHDEYEDKEAKERAYKAAVRLADSEDMQVFGAIKSENDRYAYFNFSFEAQKCFEEWYRDLLQKLKDEKDAQINAHLSKYRGLMPTIALVLHLVDCADKDEKGPITKSATLMAMHWMEYLESHARRVYALRTGEASKAAEILTEKIELEQIGTEPFTVRQITEKDWTGLTEREVIYVALDQLVAANYLRAEKAVGPGTPTIKYTVNPKVFL